MNTCNWTRGGIGLAVAALAAMTVTGCDPYMAANKDAPVVLGATMVDTRYEGFVLGALPLNTRTCTAPYPDPDLAWANTNFPGLCGGFTSVCPVNCFPPRTGPAYAPFYMGNLGSSYKTVINTNYTYTLAAAYTLNNVPSLYTDSDGVRFRYNQILVLFNKTMDPQSIQPNPNVSAPAAGITLLENGVDVTNATIVVAGVTVRRFNFEYNPNSDTSYWGASITVTAAQEGRLVANANYLLQGTVTDQQGNAVTFDVTVNTGADIVDRPHLVSYSANPATYAVGTPITPNVPTEDGGVVHSYAVLPALPAGLTLDVDTGIITGTPTTATATATYTVTATNGAGTSTLPLVITVTGAP